MQWKKKGFIGIFNGEKYKLVNFYNDNGLISFVTGLESKKYREIKEKETMLVRVGRDIYSFIPNIIDESNGKDEVFKVLKKARAIPFFISKNNKAVVQFSLDKGVEQK